MKRVWKRPVQVLSGLLLSVMCALPQGYTVSAKPGAVNYIEGSAFLNGNPISGKSFKSTFLSVNDTLSTTKGKAEVLLTPGLFLRVGDNTEIRMVSPSLTDTKVEVLGGEVMLEVAGLLKDNNVQIIDRGAYTTITKDGLYRFTADNPPTAAVLEGKASVTLNDHEVSLTKGKETILAGGLEKQKFDTKQEDDLYAWSNVRSEYSAAASYRVATAAANSGTWNGNAGAGNGYGYNGFNSFGPGWLWDSGFNSYAWLPGSGSFYSPFGYGFYSPGLVGYAPVYTTYVGSGYRHHPGQPVPVKPGATTGQPVAGVRPSNGLLAQVPVRQSMWRGAPSGASVPNLSGRGGSVSQASSARMSSAAAPSSHMSTGGMAGGGGHAAGGMSGGGGHAGGGGHR